MRTRYINDFQPRSGGFQMAADDFLARAAAESGYDAVLRFYAWSPPAVSLGYHQNVDTINLAACRTRGWEVVRRATGGRALLHKDDISYVLILTSEDNSIQHLKLIYTGVAEALKATFEYFNIPCDPASGTPALGHRPGGRLCLSSRTRGELTAGGKKLAAAAQRIYSRSILQHGSIPLRGDVGAVAEIIDTDADRRLSLSEQLRNRALTLEQAAGRFIAPAEFAAAALPRMAERFKLDLKSSAWTSEELAQMESSRSPWEVFTLA